MNRIFELPHGDVVCSVTLSKDSKTVYTGARGSVKIWDIRKQSVGLNDDTPQQVIKLEPRSTLECLENVYIRSSKLFNDGGNLIVAGESEELCIWDLEVSSFKLQKIIFCLN